MGSMGGIDIDLTGDSTETNTFTTHGIYARAQFTDDADDEGGDIEVTVADTSVTNKGAFSYGVFAEHLGKGGITVDVSGRPFTPESRNGFGVYANHAKHRDAAGTDTTVDMTVGTGMRVRAPFGNGVYGQLSVDNVAGVAISHAGAIEARDLGILARTPLGSGIVRSDGSVCSWGTIRARDNR